MFAKDVKILEENIMSKPRKKTKKLTKIYPTNERYNKKVPSTSYRIDPDTKQNLLELREASNGETWAKVIRSLVEGYEIKLTSIAEARKAGYQKGFRDAWARYAVSFPCVNCGKAIFIDNPERKERVRKLIVKAGWAHVECPKLNFTQPTSTKPIPANMSRPNPNPPVVPTDKSNGSQDKIRRFVQG